MGFCYNYSNANTSSHGSKYMMPYIAMNQFQVDAAQAAQFEERWRRRRSLLQDVPGFKTFQLLRGDETDGVVKYVSHSTLGVKRRIYRLDPFRELRAGPSWRAAASRHGKRSAAARVFRGGGPGGISACTPINLWFPLEKRTKSSRSRPFKLSRLEVSPKPGQRCWERSSISLHRVSSVILFRYSTLTVYRTSLVA
jgi:hypothetical protein